MTTVRRASVWHRERARLGFWMDELTVTTLRRFRNNEDHPYTYPTWARQTIWIPKYYNLGGNRGTRGDKLDRKNNRVPIFFFFTIRARGNMQGEWGNRYNDIASTNGKHCSTNGNSARF